MLVQMLRRFCLLMAIAFLFSFAVSITTADHTARKSKESPAILLPGLGRHHHPISAKNPEAQQFFDQGLALLFNFNHAEAARSFQRAAELDPKAAMPWWGVALALGPNYNRAIDPVSPERYQAAGEAAQKAVMLSANGPAHERAYAQAIAKRYAVDAKADNRKCEIEYMKAMGEVSGRYPDDLDAAMLYVEAIVNLRPWKLWSPDGKPAEGTLEAVRVLEDILNRYPDHPGANHYYIHVMEASPWPERALPSAHRLMTLLPGAGHLVHMPGHIFIHTGDFERMATTNERAVRADEDYFERTRVRDGVYRMMYYPHNLHFIVVARMFQGRFEEAKRAADKLADFIAPHLEEMPMLQAFVLQRLFVLLRFHLWDEVLEMPAPAEELRLSRAFWHFGRALAFAAKGKKQDALKEQLSFGKVRTALPADAMYMVNSAEKVLSIAAAVLAARLADDPREAIPHWQKAVKLEDDLDYGEPPDWYFPTRESLGAALLRNGQATEAEKVFREDLKRNRRNGRALFGLWKCLKAQQKDADAECVRLEFERAWEKAAPLRFDDF